MVSCCVPFISPPPIEVSAVNKMQVKMMEAINTTDIFLFDLSSRMASRRMTFLLFTLVITATSPNDVSIFDADDSVSHLCYGLIMRDHHNSLRVFLPRHFQQRKNIL